MYIDDGSGISRGEIMGNIAKEQVGSMENSVAYGNELLAQMAARVKWLEKELLKEVGKNSGITGITTVDVYCSLQRGGNTKLVDSYEELDKKVAARLGRK